MGLDDPSNNILTVPFAVSQASAPLAGDLELGVTTAPSTTDAFGSLLVVEVTNAAALPNGDVVVRIDIPAGLTILSPDGGAPDANFNPQTGLWTVGSVTPNGRAELQDLSCALLRQAPSPSLPKSCPRRTRT